MPIVEVKVQHLYILYSRLHSCMHSVQYTTPSQPPSMKQAFCNEASLIKKHTQTSSPCNVYSTWLTFKLPPFTTPKWIGKTRAKQAISMEPTSQPFLSAASRDRSAKTTFHIPSPHMHNEIICLHTVTVSPGACNQLTHAHKAHGSVFPEVLWPARSTACPQKLGYVDNKQVGKKKKKKNRG